MKSYYRLENSIRDYAWGDDYSIPGLLGIDYPEGKPAAELWMGAHPGCPSIVLDGTESGESLDSLISRDPESSIGIEVSDEYGRLPFLFKLLAAGKSLSIQAHPDKSTAEEGYRRENSSGIPLDSPIRNYKDDNHKPEIIMALESFTAMIGFRKTESIAHVFSELEKAAGTSLIDAGIITNLKIGEESALKAFLESVLKADAETVVALLEAGKSLAGSSDCWDELQSEWVPRLCNQFPGDIGALAPLFLNVVELKPGEALYQPARALHAYLAGFGLELMANSDNVLRGGLTPKNVDVPELMKILDFETTRPVILESTENAPGVESFTTPAREFELSILKADTGHSIIIPGGTGPAIMIVLEGSVTLNDGKSIEELKRGESVFLPASGDSLKIGGGGRVALAGVGA